MSVMDSVFPDVTMQDQQTGKVKVVAGYALQRRLGSGSFANKSVISLVNAIWFLAIILLTVVKKVFNASKRFTNKLCLGLNWIPYCSAMK